MYRDNMAQFFGECYQYNALPCVPKAVAAYSIFGLRVPFDLGDFLLATNRLVQRALRSL